MGFFQRIGNALARFMYGRNGMDQLNRALFWAYLILWLVGGIVSGILRSDLLSTVFNALTWILMVLIFFRMFSKNLYKRREENSKWLRFWWKVKNAGKGAKERHADKEHKYFTCKQCKAICRVPAGKGKVVITCPRCGNKIEGKT
jgi:hypothetical protein